MAAQAVGAETVLELFDAVFALPAIVVKGEDFRSATGAVGDQGTKVSSDSSVFSLVTDAALA